MPKQSSTRQAQLRLPVAAEAQSCAGSVRLIFVVDTVAMGQGQGPPPPKVLLFAQSLSFHQCTTFTLQNTPVPAKGNQNTTIPSQTDVNLDLLEQEM